MDSQLLISILLTLLPVIELRGGLPVVIDYCIKNGIGYWPYFYLIVFLNCIVVIFIYFFMDYLHEYFMKLKFYRRFMDYYLEKVRKKGEGFEKKTDFWLFLALAIFVAVPLPGTGAWTGAILSWMLGFSRKKSFVAISIGVLIAGFIVLALSLGAFNLLY
jgi:uncharacterized membrane protein